MQLIRAENFSWGFPGGSDGEEPACNAGDPGSIPGSGRSLAEGNGYPFQYSHKSKAVWQKCLDFFHLLFGEGDGNPLQCSCLENPRDGGARRAAVYGVAQSQTRLKRLSSSRSRRHPLAKTWTVSNSFSSPISNLFLHMFLIGGSRGSMNLHYFKIYE